MIRTHGTGLVTMGIMTEGTVGCTWVLRLYVQPSEIKTSIMDGTPGSSFIC